MIATTHVFSAWHPREGGVPVFVEQEFHFNRAVSRTEARHVIEKVEGFVIAKQRKQKERGAYIHRPRPRKQKVTG